MKKIIGIFVCMLLIATVLPVSGIVMLEKTFNPTSYENTLYVGGSDPGNYSTIQVIMENEEPIEFFDIKTPIDRKEVLSNNPPVVEIIYPTNGSIVYTRNSNISVKYADDTGLEKIELDYGGDGYQVGFGTGFYPPVKIYYLNRSMRRIRPGYNWILALAYDEEGNIGMDTAIFYYNDSNDPDLYPPETYFLHPREGDFYVFDKFRRTLNINYSIVIGKFNVVAIAEDLEWNLQKVELYIDNEVVYEQEYSNSSWDFIHWDCDKLLIGMHEIKIVAIDSYDNSAMEKLNCFIINFF